MLEYSTSHDSHVTNKSINEGIEHHRYRYMHVYYALVM